MQVLKEDTFDCVIRLVKNGEKPLALDFASGSNPGGSWRSRQQGTQEESLCRRSDLGLLLEKERYPIPLNAHIYLPKVTITRNFQGEKISPVICAVIASELRGIANSTKEYLQMRLNSLYQVAVKRHHSVIVLGAWGCGAFGETEDDATILAKEIKQCAETYKESVKTVCAVLRAKHYSLFKAVLDQ